MQPLRSPLLVASEAAVAKSVRDRAWRPRLLAVVTALLTCRPVGVRFVSELKCLRHTSAQVRLWWHMRSGVLWCSFEDEPSIAYQGGSPRLDLSHTAAPRPQSYCRICCWPEAGRRNSGKATRCRCRSTGDVELLGCRGVALSLGQRFATKFFPWAWQRVRLAA